MSDCTDLTFFEEKKMNLLYGLLDKNKSYKPSKQFNRDTKTYSLHKQSVATLGNTANYEDSVKLPKDEDLNEWLAVHVVDVCHCIFILS